MILLDTTILVYAVGTEHPLRQPCRSLLEWVRDGTVRATTTIEVVQEFAHVRARRRPLADASARARDYAHGLAPLVRPEEADLFAGLDLWEAARDLGPFDAVLAATALRRGWALASADRSFERVPGLRHVDPARVTLEEILDAGR